MSHLPSPPGVRTAPVVPATSLVLAGCGGDESAAVDTLLDSWRWTNAG